MWAERKGGGRWGPWGGGQQREGGSWGRGGEGTESNKRDCVTEKELMRGVSQEEGHRRGLKSKEFIVEGGSQGLTVTLNRDYLGKSNHTRGPQWRECHRGRGLLAKAVMREEELSRKGLWGGHEEENVT